MTKHSNKTPIFNVVAASLNGIVQHLEWISAFVVVDFFGDEKSTGDERSAALGLDLSLTSFE